MVSDKTIDRCIALTTSVFLGVLAVCSIISVREQATDKSALLVELNFRRAQVAYYTAALYGAPSDIDDAFKLVEITYKDLKKHEKGGERK